MAYVNQSDWRAKQLVQLVRALQHDDATIDAALEGAKRDHKRCNDKYIKEDKLPVLESELASILAIGQVSPRWIGILDQLNNWLATTLQEASRAPNEYEWKRLRTSDFDGKIGMSFALQWRYNFAKVFPEFKKANGRGKRKAAVVNEEGDEMDPMDE